MEDLGSDAGLPCAGKIFDEATEFEDRKAAYHEALREAWQDVTPGFYLWKSVYNWAHQADIKWVARPDGEMRMFGDYHHAAGVKHALKDMTVAEFRDRLPSDPVILLPFGSQEEQGPHAPMGDYMLTEAHRAEGGRDCRRDRRPLPAVRLCRILPRLPGRHPVPRRHLLRGGARTWSAPSSTMASSGW